ncbi:YwbE family protein [Cohnella sp. REN36]|uniref:YwbE family protein n=1 Tax=Cohnella sp. REN36 TaxID=2887347 RepID=UPI001D14F640|nr:YwbE family protein [Cohnella sp. REN36]MCC3374130.1 YwbE family protein [Cohnella sp. REN36]
MAGNGSIRGDVKPGMTVDIVLKQDQRTGKRTRGVVKDLLTNSATHPHGIKVRLQDGQVGRVKEIFADPGN